MRRFQLWHNKNPTTKLVLAYFVSDQTKEELEQENLLEDQRTTSERIRYLGQEQIRPRLATFPVSQLYDDETQRRRAQMLCDYMNRIQEAIDQAEKHAILIDAIKGAPQTP